MIGPVIYAALLVSVMGALLLLVAPATAAAASSSPPAPYQIGRFTDKGEAEWPLSEIRLLLERDSAGVPILLTFACPQGACNYYIDIIANCRHSTPRALAITPDTAKATPDTVVVNVDDALGGGAVSDLLQLELRLVKVTETECSGGTEGSSVSGTMRLEGIEGAKTVSVFSTAHPRDAENAPSPSTTSSSSSSSRAPLRSCQKPKTHRLLVFGDSLTCGYGVLGADPCPFSGPTESARLAWAGLVAESAEVHAEIVVVAWSGKGVVRNYGEATTTSTMPLPAFYNATLGSLAGTTNNVFWPPAGYTPDAVLVYLGANDYSTEPHPSDQEFVDGYLAFVGAIRLDYPASRVLLLSDEFGSGAAAGGGVKAANVARVAAASGAQFFKFPAAVMAEGPSGCNGHPSVQTQRNMAVAVGPVVASLLNS